MLKPENCLILMIDMQEKLVKATHAEQEVSQAEKLVKTAEILNIPTIVSEQYPKGLGCTLDCLKNNFQKYVEKTSFSVLKEETLCEILQAYDKTQVVLFGIEAHICVYQTAMDLLDKGYEVYLVKDASKSRNEYEFNTGIELMRQEGVKITCLEIVLFELLQSSKNPHFKEIQSLIK
ncbi:isochorismatase family protein [bacterium]|nr:isochorismatase family protein [bacterium]